MKMVLLAAMALSSFSANAVQFDIETVDVVRGAAELGIEMPISMRSDENGVCVLLGYGSGLVGSKLPLVQVIQTKSKRTRWGNTGQVSFELAPRVDTVVVDASGNLVKQVRSRQLEKVKCLKKI